MQAFQIASENAEKKDSHTIHLLGNSKIVTLKLVTWHDATNILWKKNSAHFLAKEN